MNGRTGEKGLRGLLTVWVLWGLWYENWGKWMGERWCEFKISILLREWGVMGMIILMYGGKGEFLFFRGFDLGGGGVWSR